jgi:hypothetical protein
VLVLIRYLDGGDGYGNSPGGKMNLDEILNFAIPALLLIIAFGFCYTKFIQPWIVPHLIKFWEYLNNTQATNHSVKEVTYE